MSNKTAVLRYSVSYVGPNGETVAPPTQQVLAPYQASSVGSIDVPDTQASATILVVPFGSIGTAATLVLIENQTGQELGVKINGAAAISDHIAAGGARVFGEAVAPTGVPITGITLTTTAIQAGAGSVAYHVFGDAV